MSKELLQAVGEQINHHLKCHLPASDGEQSVINSFMWLIQYMAKELGQSPSVTATSLVYLCPNDVADNFVYAAKAFKSEDL